MIVCFGGVQVADIEFSYRPVVAAVRICPLFFQRKVGGAMEILTHEIMHALGYGSLFKKALSVVGTPEQRTPQPSPCFCVCMSIDPVFRKLIFTMRWVWQCHWLIVQGQFERLI